MGIASAVAISPYAVVTAAHVGAETFVLGGTTYRIRLSEVAPKINKIATDLRVVHLVDRLPGWYALGTSANRGAAVTMVGYGSTGVVNATGTGYNLLGGGVRRAGNNVISSKETTIGRGPTMRALLDGAGDAVIASGDSGGGWFSGGKLVGISSFTFSNEPKKLAYGWAKKPYFGSGAIDLTNAKVRSWLLAESAEATLAATAVRAAPVPEPASLGAVGIGLGVLLRRRRRA